MNQRPLPNDLPSRAVISRFVRITAKTANPTLYYAQVEGSRGLPEPVYSNASDLLVGERYLATAQPEQNRWMIERGGGCRTRLYDQPSGTPSGFVYDGVNEFPPASVVRPQGDWILGLVTLNYPDTTSLIDGKENRNTLWAYPVADGIIDPNFVFSGYNASVANSPYETNAGCGVWWHPSGLFYLVAVVTRTDFGNPAWWIHAFDPDTGLSTLVCEQTSGVVFPQTLDWCNCGKHVAVGLINDDSLNIYNFDPGNASAGVSLLTQLNLFSSQGNNSPVPKWSNQCEYGPNADIEYLAIIGAFNSSTGALIDWLERNTNTFHDDRVETSPPSNTISFISALLWSPEDAWLFMGSTENISYLWSNVRLHETPDLGTYPSWTPGTTHGFDLIQTFTRETGLFSGGFAFSLRGDQKVITSYPSGTGTDFYYINSPSNAQGTRITRSERCQGFEGHGYIGDTKFLIGWTNVNPIPGSVPTTGVHV